VRVTFGTFRVGVREPGFRISTAGPVPTFPTAVASLRKAVRVFHRDGPSEARRALTQSLAGPYWQAGSGLGKANMAHDLLARYVSFAEADGRSAFDFDVETDVVLGPDVIAVKIDVALMDPSGQAGRLLLWDTRPCTREQALVLAAPTSQALAQELGADRVANVGVWHLRDAQRYEFDYAEASDALPSAQSALRRIVT